MISHAVWIAQGMENYCISGCGEVHVNDAKKTIVIRTRSTRMGTGYHLMDQHENLACIIWRLECISVFGSSSSFDPYQGLEVDDRDTAEKDSQSVQPMEILVCDLPQQDVSITGSNNVAFVGEGNADIMEVFKDDISNSQLTADSGHGIFGINKLTSLSTSSTVLVNSEEDLLLSCPVVTSEDRISPSNDLSPTTFLENCIGFLIQDGGTDASQQSSSPKADHVVAIPAVLRGVAENPSARYEVNGKQIGGFDRLANASIETQGFVEPPPCPASDETSIDSKESKQELALVSCDKLNNNNGQNSLVEESSPGAEENDLEFH